MKLDSEAPTPLYHQVARKLEEEIKNGKYEVGDKLPPEKDLEKNLNVSRTTVRKALDTLLQKGLIERKRGVGTIVVEPKVQECLPQLQSFTEEMSLRGYSVNSKVLGVNKIKPKANIQNALRLSDEEEVIKIERIRFIEEQKLALHTAYIPNYVGISIDEDFSGSLYKKLENEYKVEIDEGKTTITSSIATEKEANLLDIEKKDPILKYDRLTFNKKGEEIEFVEGVYRADKYQFKVRLKR